MAGNIAKRANGKWRARYRDEAGNERARHFDRKIDAQQWLDQVTSAVVTGTYADPKAGRVTFSAFFGEWSARQVWAPGTVLAMSLAARSVPFAGKPMKQVRRSDIETWVKQMNAVGLTAGTRVRRIFRREGITVDGDVHALRIELHVVVEHGLNLAEVASTVRSQVGYDVERLTGLTVASVEVVIQRVKQSA